MSTAAGGSVIRAAAHALDVLGFTEALERVAAHAGSALGRAAILASLPSDDPDWIGREIGRVAELTELMESEAGWRATAVPDARGPLRAAATAGSVLGGADLLTIARLLEATGEAAAQLEAADAAPLLAPLRDRLHPDDALRQRIDAAVDADGAVRDDASRELRRIRRELEQARSRIVRELERFAAGLPDRVRVPDASVSVRDGRYVIAIRREGRGVVGGLVHDESASGATLFVEPPIAVDLMNRLRELERAETREVRRILAELTDAMRPSADALRASLEALVALDSLVGRARYALSVGARPPRVAGGDGPRLRILGGAHPSLYGEGGDPIPFDLELDADERTLVVSGPNTGGKTVLLKAIGLIAALHQAGVVPPVRAGTILPIFGGFFADIGDEQSIQASLSTFSARLHNLRQLLEQARPDSLVLIDELGSGTDPAEGAALARAVLETLTRTGATTAASTHLGALKRLASETEGVVNASMQFDAGRLEPTYRLEKGIPGRSYGLAIARRLGFPEALVDRAEALLPDAEREAERLLSELEARVRAAENARSDAETRAADAREREARLAEREAEVDARQRQIDLAASEGARALLMEARAEVDAAIAIVRDAGAAGLEEAAGAARAHVEAAARGHAERAERARRSDSGAEPAPDGFVEGEAVRVRSTGAAGTLLELRDGAAVVDVRGVRLRVPADELEPAPETGGQARRAGDASRSRAAAPPPAAAAVDASSEVDLRGLRAEEVAGRLHPALDAAIVADLRSLRIIHGKGHGVLREVVAELLAADRRVASTRSGGVGEGGSGVTVAELGA